MSEAQSTTLAEITTEVVAAYIGKNHVQPSDVPGLIATIHASFSTLGSAVMAAPEPAKMTPPVSIKKSITDEYIISMEDGKQYQSLKRHLTKHGLTPAEYREKWGLPKDYPMVAAAYSAKRSALAKSLGLGNKRQHA